MKTYQKVIIIISILAVLFLSLSIAYMSETKETKDTIITMDERDSLNVIAYPNDSVFLSIKSFTGSYFFDCTGNKLCEKRFVIRYSPEVVIVQDVTKLDVPGYFVSINNTGRKTEIGTVAETTVGIQLINESVFINPEDGIFAKIQLKAVGSAYNITNKRSFLEITQSEYQEVNNCLPTPGCSRVFHGGQIRGDFRIVSPGIITRLLIQGISEVMPVKEI